MGRSLDGFAIHDYGDYQPTREKLDERRRQYRESKRETRQAARGVHRGHTVESTRVHTMSGIGRG